MIYWEQTIRKFLAGIPDVGWVGSSGKELFVSHSAVAYWATREDVPELCILDATAPGGFWYNKETSRVINTLVRSAIDLVKREGTRVSIYTSRDDWSRRPYTDAKHYFRIWHIDDTFSFSPNWVNSAEQLWFDAYATSDVLWIMAPQASDCKCLSRLFRTKHGTKVSPAKSIQSSTLGSLVCRVQFATTVYPTAVVNTVLDAPCNAHAVEVYQYPPRDEVVQAALWRYMSTTQSN